jgi:hypothetical protein
MYCFDFLFCTDEIIRELKGGTQGFVYVVEDMETHEQLCLKSMSIQESKRGDYEKTMSILKLVSESDVKDVFVKYKEHFFQEKNAGVMFLSLSTDRFWF